MTTRTDNFNVLSAFGFQNLKYTNSVSPKCDGVKFGKQYYGLDVVVTEFNTGDLRGKLDGKFEIFWDYFEDLNYGGNSI